MKENRKGQAIQITGGVVFGLFFLIVIVFAAFLAINIFTTSIFTTPTSFSETFVSRKNGTSFDLQSSPTTITSSTTPTQTWLNFQNGLDVDNGDFGENFSYINFTSTIPNTAIWNNFSWSVWVNKTLPLNASPEDQMVIMGNLFAYSGLSPQRNGWQTVFSLGCCGDFSWNNVSNSSGFPDCVVNNSRFNHLAGTYNGSYMNIWCDGTSSTQTQHKVTGSLGNTTQFWVGSAPSFSLSNGNGEGMGGEIDEVRLYNRSLSEAEILDINSSGRTANSSLSSSGLVVWASMNENQGTNVINKAPGARGNGTFVTGTAGFSTTYNRDGTTSLVQNTDYSISGELFTVINSAYEYSQVIFAYQNGTFSSSGRAAQSIEDNYTSGFSQFTSQIPTVFKILGVVMILAALGILIIMVLRFRGEERGSL